MIISITGTPGTGKTQAGKELAKLMNANLISLSSIEKRMKSPLDKKRKVKIIDIKELAKRTEKLMKPGINIFEGHLSHFLKPDIIIVLRCRPDVLEKRLKKRRYSKAKILENIQSEILDSSTIEALENCKKVYEIDTTEKTSKNTVKLIKKFIDAKDKKCLSDYMPGKIDWSEKFKNYLLKFDASF